MHSNIPDIEMQALMVSAIYGEATAEELEVLQAALAKSEKLRSEYEDMQSTLELVDNSIALPDPGEEYWDNTWDRFRDSLVEQEIQHTEKVAHISAWSQFWKPALQIATVAAMLVIGIFIGRQFTVVPKSEPIAQTQFKEIPETNYMSEPVEANIRRERDNYFQTVANNSLQQSSEVITGFMKLHPVEAGEESLVEWIQNSEVELETLRQNISILRSAQQDGSIKEIEPILQELELLLDEIATIRSLNPSDMAFEVQFLQNGIARRNLENRLQQVRVHR